MRDCRILIIGGGIGGLTAAITLGRAGHEVHLIERDAQWSVYGVGIIQQSNVLRAARDLGILDEYLASGVGFDTVEVYLPNGVRVARVPSHRLVEGCPANIGIGRRALHTLLVKHARAAGARIELGVVATNLAGDADGVTCTLSNGRTERFDLVVGADGVHSHTRATLFPEAARPAYTGQAVWRYNLPRAEGLDCLRAFNGPTGVGLVPLSNELMYLFATTAEPGNPRYPVEGLAARMRERLAGTAPAIRGLASGITDDEAVVYRPLEWLYLDGPWHRGRCVLLGDAVHATTPHLGQGGGMAIEDALVLAEEVGRHDDPEAAFTAYRQRRHERCRYIVDASLAICRGQLGEGPLVDNARATKEMFDVVAQPI